MGIFTRVRDIVNSNINSALDKAENPEKLIKQMIREMEDTLVEIKAACAGAMAGRKKAERDANDATSLVKHWTERAELAVTHGRENLAREALRAKQRFTNEAETTQTVIDQLAGLVDQYKSDIVQIENKLQGAREKQRVLVQRHVHAQKHKKVQMEIRKLDTSGVMIRFDEFEQRLDRAKADGDLVNFGRPKPYSLEQEFVYMERDETIEDELNALKAKVKKNTAEVAIA
ncbi:MAG: PspA/IM30 family protein [Candidatus Hydrogenedentota bacterium]